jgi:hypothetical protein
MYNIVLCGKQQLSPSTHTSKATASTVIATGNLRQGRLMADHGGPYSVTKLRLKMAKAGCARVAFPITLQRGKEKGDCGCGRMVYSLVALNSLLIGSRGHSGAVRCSSFLGGFGEEGI